MTTEARPEARNTVTPYLAIDGAARAIEFYTQVFGAVETPRVTGNDGRVGHSELKIGNSTIFLADEFPEINVRGPHTRGGSSVNIYLLVDDADEVMKKAIAGGGKIVTPLSDEGDGDRRGTMVDPFGHIWMVATHKGDVPNEEYRKSAGAAGYKVEFPTEHKR